jgi:hypothetical protein
MRILWWFVNAGTRQKTSVDGHWRVAQNLLIVKHALPDPGHFAQSPEFLVLRLRST